MNAKQKPEFPLLLSNKTVNQKSEKVIENNLLNILTKIKHQVIAQNYKTIQLNTYTNQTKKRNTQEDDLNLFIFNALDNKEFQDYWRTDYRDEFTVYPGDFNFIETQSNIEILLKFSSEYSVFNRFKFSYFPQKYQFYWVLPGNRIVMVNQGWHSGVVYQGESTNFQTIQKISLDQTFLDRQPVFSPPQSLQESTGEISINQFDIEPIAEELTNSVGVAKESQQNLYDLNTSDGDDITERQNNFTERQNNFGFSQTFESLRWHKFYWSYSQNQTLLNYDALEAKATYTNIYTNPGISLFLTFSGRRIDELQTANSTLGMLIGGILAVIDFPHLTQSLKEAQERFNRQEILANLYSKATPEQRRQINQTLNSTLLLANRTSGLEQVSGTVTFPSIITPNSSSLLQIRTGNHRRGVQFFDERRTCREGKNSLPTDEVTQNSVGSLTSGNSFVSPQQTSHPSSTTEMDSIAPHGEQYVQNGNSSDMTSVPMDIPAFDVGFDCMGLNQDSELITDYQSFDGYLSLPTIEFLWAGSSSNWNYSINSGIWFNLNANTAFNITNNFGLLEPTVGIYAKGSLNYVDTHVEIDSQGETQTITNHIPSLQFSWNSAANFQNPTYLNLSYFFSHQDRKKNYSLSTAIILMDDQYSLTTYGFLQGKLGLITGLELSTSLDIGTNIFYTLEGIQQVNSLWSLGVYLQNFRNIDIGVTNRVADFSYGLIIKRDPPGSGAFWESRIGKSGDIFEASFEGGVRF